MTNRVNKSHGKQNACAAKQTRLYMRAVWVFVFVLSFILENSREKSEFLQGYGCKVDKKRVCREYYGIRQMSGGFLVNCLIKMSHEMLWELVNFIVFYRRISTIPNYIFISFYNFILINRFVGFLTELIKFLFPDFQRLSIKSSQLN